MSGYFRCLLRKRACFSCAVGCAGRRSEAVIEQQFRYFWSRIHANWTNKKALNSRKSVQFVIWLRSRTEAELYRSQPREPRQLLRLLRYLFVKVPCVYCSVNLPPVFKKPTGSIFGRMMDGRMIFITCWKRGNNCSVHNYYDFSPLHFLTPKIKEVDHFAIID